MTSSIGGPPWEDFPEAINERIDKPFHRDTKARRTDNPDFNYYHIAYHLLPGDGRLLDNQCDVSDFVELYSVSRSSIRTRLDKLVEFDVVQREKVGDSFYYEIHPDVLEEIERSSSPPPLARPPTGSPRSTDRNTTTVQPSLMKAQLKHAPDNCTAPVGLPHLLKRNAGETSPQAHQDPLPHLERLRESGASLPPAVSANRETESFPPTEELLAFLPNARLIASILSQISAALQAIGSTYHTKYAKSPIYTPILAGLGILTVHLLAEPTNQVLTGTIFVVWVLSSIATNVSTHPATIAKTAIEQIT